MNQIDKDIIERCRVGDKTAFRMVVQHYQRLVFSLAFKMLCDEEEAKDMTQETFIRVWLNFPKYDKERSLTTWIYTIATRLCLDRLEKRSHQVPLPDDDSTFRQYAEDDDPDRQLQNSELISVVRTLADRLSPKQRAVFTLVYLENLETDKVAEITGMDADKIKSNLYVARKTIKEKLIQLGYE